jgi:pimeloyl-ACP methyl ester carboxylesterase
MSSDIKVGQENSTPIEVYYEDHGSGSPVVLIHGLAAERRVVGKQAKMIKNARFVELRGGPHGVLWTHADQVNSELVKFLA